MNTAVITFLDGSEIAVEVNGDSFILDEEPEFPDDLSAVTITEGEDTRELWNVKVQECASIDGRYWFAFVQISEVELRFAELEDALCELSIMEG